METMQETIDKMQAMLERLNKLLGEKQSVVKR